MFESILDRVYRLSPPSRTRPSNKSMEVLCLGLTGNDTDSLRSALTILGYGDVYHGSVITARQRSDCAFWGPLLERKFNNQALDTKSIDFDSVLGNCQAAMDGPVGIFGEELMEYYPSAKVILNRKSDINAWCTSLYSTYLQFCGFTMWYLTLFDAQLYWIWRTFQLVLQGYFDNDFEENGKSYAKAHYINMKDYLKDHQRAYLEWSEGDGWEPLCKFLDKPVPKQEFPRSSQPKEQGEDYLKNKIGDLKFAAVRNLSIFVALTAIPMYLFRDVLLVYLIITYRIIQSSTVKEEVFPEMIRGVDHQ